MDCENIFNIKNPHAICHSNPYFTWSLPYLPFSLAVINLPEVWSGCKLFAEVLKGKGRKPSEVSMILYVVFVATELHPDTIFFQHFLA